MNQTGYEHIIAEIEKHKDHFSKQEQKKYKLDLLARLAKRTTSFSPECTDCAALQWEIQRNTESLTTIIRLSDEERSRYMSSIRKIVSHLKKKHKLVTQGQYKHLGIAIGLAIGSIIGVATRKYGLGIPMGVSLGMTIGSGLDKKAEKDGRVI